MKTLPRAVSPLLWCLLVVLLPRVGLAAGDVPRAGLPRLALSGPLAGPETSPDPANAWWEEPVRPPRELRVLTEVGAGLATSLVGAVGLGLAGGGLCSATGWGKGHLGCIGPLVLGGLVGLVEGYALGVWWGGEVMKGDGSLALTLLGANAGALVGYALAASGQPEVGGPSAVVLTVLLSHLGYELFQRAPASVQPLVTFSSQGARLGVGGRF